MIITEFKNRKNIYVLCIMYIYVLCIQVYMQKRNKKRNIHILHLKKTGYVKRCLCRNFSDVCILGFRISLSKQIETVLLKDSQKCPFRH